MFPQDPENVHANAVDRDIVDHKHFLSSVDLILLGAASPNADSAPHTPPWVIAEQQQTSALQQ